MQLKVKDLDFHYESRGEGRALLALHGAGPDHRSMMACLEPLFTARPGWQRVYPDLPGFGRTKAPGRIHSSEQMLEAVCGFIDALLPGKPLALVGTSYGAYLARGLVRLRPQQLAGICLVVPVIIAEHTKRTLPDKRVLVRDEPFMASLTPADRQTFEGYAVVQTRQTWERTRADMGDSFEIMDQPFIERLQTQGYPFPYDVDDIPPFEKPALILCGRQDQMVGFADSWQILSTYLRATLAVLDKAGHNLEVEQEELFNAHVSEWLERVERENPS